MFSSPPKKCPCCGAQVFVDLFFREGWEKLATVIECVDEGGGTIGYNVICYNCNEGVCDG